MKVSVTLKSSIIAWPFHAVFTKPHVRFGEKYRHLIWGRRELIDISAESTLSVGFPTSGPSISNWRKPLMARSAISMQARML